VDSTADVRFAGSGTLTISTDRTSGQSVMLSVSLPLGGSAVTVQYMQLQAQPVRVARTVKVTAEDPVSIDTNGRRTHRPAVPWITRHDAAAVADLILGMRAQRLPVLQVTVKSGNDTRLTQQLARDLSDRVRIIESELGLDGEFYIEQIHHTVREAGLLHETTFGVEKVPTLPSTAFTFDATGKGFNDGVFAPSGLDSPSSVFIFDHATQGQFGVGLLGT
jgi:hypothetical protein